MNLPAFCVRRPVMTVLLSLSVILAGILSYQYLPVAALPNFDSPIISVSANLAGASPETMASSVALPLEKQFSSLEGLASMSSVNTQGASTITLEFNAKRDIDAAAADVQAALLRAQRSLPTEMTQLPSYRKNNPADAPVLLLALSSSTQALSTLNEFAENVISPRLATIPGVAQVGINGQKRFAVRIQADPQALTARNLSLDDLATAIRQANANTPVGTLENDQQFMSIQANEPLMRAETFMRLIVGQINGQPIYLRDVATAIDSYESLKTAANYNGTAGIILAVQRQPQSNTVAVVDQVRQALPELKAQLPQDVVLEPLNDRSNAIREAVHDVQWTLALTVGLVILVVYLGLGNGRATLIPAVTVPISLLATLPLAAALGYSLNNVSLLAITLAVGLVVDDAIVVLENIVRHLEMGKTRLQAAIDGGGEVMVTVLSISLSLVAVFIPIFFMPGVIGGLFHEFAAIVSLSVLVSALVSLTLVPLLSSWLLQSSLSHTPSSHPSTRWWQRFTMQGLQHGYVKTVRITNRYPWLMGLLTLGTIALTVALVMHLPKGFFPEEDTGLIRGNTEAREDISFTAMTALQSEVVTALRKHPAVESVSAFQGSGGPGGASTQNTGRLFISLKPRQERPAMAEVMKSLRQQAGSVPGIQVYLSPIQSLQLGGRASKSRYQYTLQGVESEELNLWAGRFQDELRRIPGLVDVTSDSQNTGLQAKLNIDREQAARLGIDIQSVRNTLLTAFGERQVSTIYASSNSYLVFLEVQPHDKRYDEDMLRISVRANTGKLIPLANFCTVERTAGPTAVNHQGQLQAITLSFNLAPGIALGQAIQAIDATKAKLNPPATILTRYAGDAAVYQSSQGGQLVLIAVAVMIMYVLLGCLYENAIHPVTILIGLPSAAVGALLTLKLWNLELTLIATIGILLLLGIVKKNAIMLIDFALEVQRTRGLGAREAIEEACAMRFRPIMMTTLTALVGAMPIAFGLGAGAEFRMPLGLSVVGGLIVSQAITLYITPAIFLLFSRK